MFDVVHGGVGFELLQDLPQSQHALPQLIRFHRLAALFLIRFHFLCHHIRLNSLKLVHTPIIQYQVLTVQKHVISLLTLCELRQRQPIKRISFLVAVRKTRLFKHQDRVRQIV